MIATPDRAPESSLAHNLPAPVTSLVGRERELAAIAEALRGSRLVTLAGPGGVGKTRLALEVARGQLDSRAGGVWFVDLAPKPETPDVAAETARVLDVQTRAGTTPTEALRRYLANRDLLLVLDNCEQVVDECAELAAILLTSCTDVRMLTTSREPLGVDGETVWRLDPLVPEEAYDLFVARARQRRADFQPDADTHATIGELCERVDRLPLAIELAAARASVMSPAEILSGLAVRLGELGGGRRLGPSHHRSVRAAVEWSYQLLDPVEQEAFRALAVFVGGFDAGAARSVAPRLSLDLLARLVDKSLVAVAETSPGRTRYRLLETMREYADELLVEAGELDEARERHLDHFSALADVPETAWPSAHAQASVGELAADYENVRAALEWAAASDVCGARPLLARARDLFFMLGATDGRRLAQLLLDRCPAHDRERAELLVVAGVLAFIVADAEEARRVLVEAQELSAELGEQGLEGWAHSFLGLTETLDGRIEPAREHLEATRALHDESGAASAWRRATAVLGLNYLITNEPDRARELVEQALAANVAEEDEWGQGQCNVYLGQIAEATGADPEVVTSHYRQAVDFMRLFRGGPLLPVALVGQAGVLVRDDPARALRVVAAAYALNERTGGGFSRVYRERAERTRAAAEAAVGTDAGRAWAEGRRLSVDDAVELAFEMVTPVRVVQRTFMFTDIVESTNLAEAVGDEAWEGLIGWHDATLCELFGEHGGEVVNHTGDGFFVAFPDAAAAIACAIAVQRRLAAHRRSHGFAPQVRIGLHNAAAAGGEGAYRGKGVHAAARIAALAEGGEILASQATHAAAPAGACASEPREVSLKGLSAPVDVVSLEWRT